MKYSRRIGSGGFTLLEMLVAIAIVGVILTVSAPSIKKYLESQRLRSVNGELMNDLQFARSEAVARKQVVGIRLEKDSGYTCYTVAAYVGTNCIAPADAKMTSCDCRLGAGSACSGNWVEIKSVRVLESTGVSVNYTGSGPSAEQNVGFDPVSGQLSYCNPNRVGGIPGPFVVKTNATSAELRTNIAPAGRPRTCVFSGTVAGVPAC